MCELESVWSVVKTCYIRNVKETCANMDAKDFREFGRAAIDFVADYMENVQDR